MAMMAGACFYLNFLRYLYFGSILYVLVDITSMSKPYSVSLGADRGGPVSSGGDRPAWRSNGLKVNHNNRVGAKVTMARRASIKENMAKEQKPFRRQRTETQAFFRLVL